VSSEPDAVSDPDEGSGDVATEGNGAHADPVTGNGATGTATERDGEELDGDRDGDRRTQRQALRTEARRVRRVVRKVDPWSVLKVSLIFYACIYVIVMVAAVLLWSAAASSGTVDNIEDFVIDLGFSDFQFKANQMFRAALFGGAILMVIGTGFTVLCSVLFNMISDLVGGVRVTMIEQQLEAPPASDDTDSVSTRPGL
jgi:hypothetical protein